MKKVATFEEFVNEQYLHETMSFSEIKDKYLDNPYGIGANSIEYIEGKNGNSAMLIFRDEDKYGRDQIEKTLKDLGISSKKMRKSTADKAFKYRYELTLFENEVIDEALSSDNQVIDIVKELALNIFGQKAISIIDQDMIEISTAATSKQKVEEFIDQVNQELGKAKSDFEIDVDEKEKTVKVYA